MLRYIGYYHLLQSFLLTLNLWLIGYTVRTDFSGTYDSILPIAGNLVLGVTFILTNTKIRLAGITYSPLSKVFIGIWIVSAAVKIFGVDNFLVNALFNTLMPALLLVHQSLRRRWRTVIYVIVIYNFFHYSLLGARGYALLPLILVSLNSVRVWFSKKMLTVKVLYISLIVLFGSIYLTVVEAYRVLGSRDEINVSLMLDILFKGREYLDEAEKVFEFERGPWDRLLNHPMNRMFLNDYKHRGIDYLPEDALLIVSRSASNPNNKSYGHWLSSEYGFFAGATSSVEWSVLSDLSSRFGPWVGMLLTYLVILLLNRYIVLVAKMSNIALLFSFYYVLTMFYVYSIYEILNVVFKTTLIIIFTEILFRDVFYSNRKFWTR